MEVVRNNFKETLPLVSNSIKNADFLAIDMEFTGLINGRDVSMFDTPEQYYLCLLKGSTDFLPIQFGLCTFQWDEKEKHYAMDAYNFYLFPREKFGQNKAFLCQSSCLDFLASQGFDFNKLIKEGISYMTEPSETRLRNNMKIKHEALSKERETIVIPDEHKQLVEESCMKVKIFLEEQKCNEMVLLERSNSLLRLLLHQELKNRFKSKVYVHSVIEDNQTRLKVTRVNSEEEVKSLEMQKRQQELDDLEDAVGFSKVAKLISTSEKLVVGHNMLFDVLHTVNQFFQPLPPDYVSFKELTHFMFPSLLDTKYMASLPPFKDKVNSSVLKHLLTTLSEAPFTMPKVESRSSNGYSQSNEKQHEAGYDAYITGLCFLAMYAHLSRMRGEEPSQYLSPHSAALKPFLNKLFLSKTARQESPYINLDGPDPNPSRDHVFHITFPREWQRTEINQLFSPFGPVVVQFVDDTSALVALTWKEHAQCASKILSKHSKLRVMSYHRYRTLLNNSSQKTGSGQCATLTNNTKMNATEETREPPALASNVTASPVVQANNVPVKVARERSNSVSLAQSTQPPRKRTASGVFLIQNGEPTPRKLENVEPETEVSKKKKFSCDTSGNEEKIKEKRKVKKKEKIIERFDPEATTNCVSDHFKESDNWD